MTGRPDHCARKLEITVYWTEPHRERFFAAWTMETPEGKLRNLWLGRLGLELRIVADRARYEHRLLSQFVETGEARSLNETASLGGEDYAEFATPSDLRLWIP